MASSFVSSDVIEATQPVGHGLRNVLIAFSMGIVTDAYFLTRFIDHAPPGTPAGFQFELEFAILGVIIIGGVFAFWFTRRLLDPKFRYWLFRIPYIVTTIKTNANELLDVLHPNDSLLAGGQVMVDNYAYTLRDVDENGRPTRFTKYGHPAYIFNGAGNDGGKTFPEAFEEGGSLDSFWTPRTYGELGNSIWEKHWNAPKKSDHGTAILGLLIVMMMFLFVITAVVLQQTGLIQHLQQPAPTQPVGPPVVG